MVKLETNLSEFKTMSKLFGLILTIIITLMMLPSNLKAWGSATHAYIAKQLCEDVSEPLLIYSSALPDFFNQERNSVYFNYLTKATHFNLNKIRKESNKRKLYEFILGYLSHNEKWGADLTAHKKARTIRKKGYASEKGNIIGSKIIAELEKHFTNQGVSFPFMIANAVSSEIAHPLIEIAVDLQIRTYEDILIGRELISSAIDRTDDVQEILISAYANELSKKYKIPKTEAEDIIRNAENDFREDIIKFGVILNYEYDTAIQLLAQEGADLINYFLASSSFKGCSVTAEIMKKFIQIAIDETANDYQKEVSETIKYLKKRSEIKQLCRKILKQH